MLSHVCGETTLYDCIVGTEFELVPGDAAARQCATAGLCQPQERRQARHPVSRYRRRLTTTSLSALIKLP